MRPAHLEFAHLETRRRLDPDLFDALSCEAITFAVFVSEWPSRIVKSLRVDVGEIRSIVSADPASVIVVTNVWQRKTEPCVAGKIPTLVAVNVSFVNLAGTENGVRIDEQIAWPVALFDGPMTQPLEPVCALNRYRPEQFAIRVGRRLLSRANPFW